MAWGFKETLKEASARAQDGEVIDFNVATLENSALACHSAKQRLERAFDELAKAADHMRACQSAFSEKVNTAQLGVTCNPYAFDLRDMVLRMFERNRG